MPPDGVGEWEANTERRLGILEHKMDKLLDPEAGIYPLLNVAAATAANVAQRAETRLTRWAIAILTSVVGTLITIIVTR
jgi:hypothetical protein